MWKTGGTRTGGSSTNIIFLLNIKVKFGKVILRSRALFELKEFERRYTILEQRIGVEP
jgi:hypothetical protein